MRVRKNVLTGAPNVKLSGGLMVGTALPDTANYPTDATTEASELMSKLGLASLGYISDDGVSKTVDRSTDKIKDWNGDTVMIVQSDHSVSLKFTCLEAANVNVLKLVYGEENVQVNGGKITTVDTAVELPHRSFMFDINGGNGSKIRLFVPDGQVTEVGDVTFVRSDVVRYEVTIEAFGDEAGKKMLQFIDRAVPAISA